MTAASDQLAILQYLNRRIKSGDSRYCTVMTLGKNIKTDKNNQYIMALTDDLEGAGLVKTRQAYQISGHRLFQITAAGIDAVEFNNLPIVADSSAWTGKTSISASQKNQIQEILSEIRSIVYAAKLSNARTANAVALIEAAEKLIETPDPLWPEIMRLLRSPTVAGITGVAGLILSIAQIIMASASS